jgi:short-subunit dehydrogenase
MEHSSELKPWVAITGSSSGIGKAAARYLAARGFGVVIASEQFEANRQVAEEIRQDGGRAEWVDLDLLNPEHVESFLERVHQKVGFCEILVNNAGIGLHKRLDESTDAEFRRVFEVNFFSLTNLCRQAVAYMKKEGRGHIINISSASARRSLNQMSCYGATKGAVHCFSQALRLEVAPLGIAVTEILPISVRTEFFDRAGYQPKGLVQTPEHIAALIERAIRTREAELCSSQLSRLGFLLDVVAPNFTSKLLSWHQRRQKRKG